jgi:hypothetical protein
VIVRQKAVFYERERIRERERLYVILTKNASLVTPAASKYSMKALSVGAKTVNEPPDKASESPATSMASARVCEESIL